MGQILIKVKTVHIIFFTSTIQKSDLKLWSCPSLEYPKNHQKNSTKSVRKIVHKSVQEIDTQKNI